jgi:hypothetical protein
VCSRAEKPAPSTMSRKTEAVLLQCWQWLLVRPAQHRFASLHCGVVDWFFVAQASVNETEPLASNRQRCSPRLRPGTDTDFQRQAWVRWSRAQYTKGRMLTGWLFLGTV